MVGKEDHPDAFVTVEVDDYQNLKDIEDRILDVQLCLDSTLDTLSTFLDMHVTYLHNASDSSTYGDPVPRQGLKKDLISYVLKEKQRDVTLSRRKTETMLAKAQTSRALVCLPEDDLQLYIHMKLI